MYIETQPPPKICFFQTVIFLNINCCYYGYKRDDQSETMHVIPDKNSTIKLCKMSTSVGVSQVLMETRKSARVHKQTKFYIAMQEPQRDLDLRTAIKRSKLVSYYCYSGENTRQG